MKLRRISKTIFSGAVILAVALTGTVREARADEKPAIPKLPSVPKGLPVKAPVDPKAAGSVQLPKAKLPAAKTPTASPGTKPLGTTPPRSPNVRPVGSSVVAPIKNSNARYTPAPGSQSKALPNGLKETRESSGRVVTTNASGDVRRISSPRGLAGGNKIVINRGSAGGRLVETGRPGSRVVSYGPQRGFVERPLRPGYISRTYVGGPRSYAHVYREYRYNNVVYYNYVPAYYYGPRYYFWAVSPWAVAAPYVWFGLATPAPWFYYYGGYFTPYPLYASPDLWLTDYVIAENLRLAYESQVAAYAGQAPPPPDAQSAAALTPEMKALIDDEVRQQIAAERVASGAQPASGTEQMPPALTQTYFVVSASLDIPAIACSLTPGDLIQRTGNGVTAEGGVTVAVVSSKPGDCVPGSSAAVQLADLQNMQNQFRENIDAGLKMLADNQARGLPNGPPAGARPVAEGTASPAPDAATQLTQQEAEATNLEAQVRKAGGGN